PRAPLLLLISLVRIRLQAAYRGLWAASLLSLPQTLCVLQRLQLRLGPKRLDRDWVLNGPATGAMQNRHLPRSAPESVQDQGHPLALAGAAWPATGAWSPVATLPQRRWSSDPLGTHAAGGGLTSERKDTRNQECPGRAE